MAYLLSEILSPDLPQDELVAVNPNWTRREFNQAVLGLSHYLKNQENQKNQDIKEIIFWFEDTAYFACALLAACHAGVRVVLLPNLTESQLNQLNKLNQEFNNYNYLIWTDNPEIYQYIPNYSNHLNHSNNKINVINQEFIQNHINNLNILNINNLNWKLNKNTEILLKTSGSSGEAKTITKTLGQLESESYYLAQSPDFLNHLSFKNHKNNYKNQDNQDIIALGTVSPQHMYGLTFRFALSLSLNWQIHRQQIVFPEELVQQTKFYLEKNQKIIWITSPAILNRLIEFNLDNLKKYNQNNYLNNLNIISAGGALPQRTAATLAAYHLAPNEIYGSTETGVIATRQADGTENNFWQLFDSIEIKINNIDNLNNISIQSDWLPEYYELSDLIEFNPENFNQFKLLGRKDRMIKWEDKRISLNQIEHELLSHQWVTDVHCGTHSDFHHLGIWVALNDLGIQAWREQGRKSVITQLKQHLAKSQEKIAIPRHWRFESEVLPRNAQGKISAQDFHAVWVEKKISPIFEKNIFNQDNQDINQFEFKALIPLDLIYFSGHFARFPLVPGVVEIQWVKDLINQIAPDYWDNSQYSLIRMEHLKFQQFIRPNDSINIQIEMDRINHKIYFKIEKLEKSEKSEELDKKICASGRFIFQKI